MNLDEFLSVMKQGATNIQPLATVWCLFWVGTLACVLSWKVIKDGGTSN